MGSKSEVFEPVRQFPRRDYCRKVGILFAGIYTVVESIEISEGGLSFYSDQVFTKDRECVLNFQIPSGGFLSVRGVVKRMTKEGLNMVVGVSFEQLPFSNKRQIRNYVADRESKRSN